MFTRFWKQYGGTTAYPYGDPGEGVSYFYTAATRRFTITSLEWRIEFAGGSTCLAGNCTFFICQDQGIQYPRCAQSNDPIGTTYTFNGEVFEPYENNRFFIAVWITGGPAVSATTTYEMIIAHHNSI
jgi:hypothetical protein